MTKLRICGLSILLTPKGESSLSKLSLPATMCLVFFFCTAVEIVAPAQSVFFTTLASFNGTDGANSGAALIQGTDGNLFGTTTLGGAYNYGAVFKITPGGELTTLYSFDNSDGSEPWAALVQASDGNFYGTTLAGGAYGGGTVFKITLDGGLTTLYSFCPQTPCADGAGLYAGLVQGTDGNFYGTTFGGGAYGDGTVFKITPSGWLTTLYSFCPHNPCADGSEPWAALVQASDGNFYGTTLGGGAYGDGTVFTITPSGTLTTLHSFDGSDGANPRGSVVQARDGNFYGTTFQGGNLHCVDGGCGTVFKITPAGALTTLYSFNGTNGAHPWNNGGLVQASNGNFFGTTFEGGNIGCVLFGYGCGTVFEITPQGGLTTLYCFCSQPSCADGISPDGGLLQATDGNFYGTTGGGGAYGWGTVFRLGIVRTCATCRTY